MPYIDPFSRTLIDDGHPPEDVGQLTYAITRLCRHYLSFKQGRFRDLADVVAALECAKLEFYRRTTAPYEDRKLAENGDL